MLFANRKRFMKIRYILIAFILWASTGYSQNVPASQIASEYSLNKQSADAQYKDKSVTVKGTVLRLEKAENTFDGKSNALVVVYLTTGPGLPLVKAYVTQFKAIQAEQEKLNKFLAISGRSVTVEVMTRIVAGTVEAQTKTVSTSTFVQHSANGNTTITNNNFSGWKPMAKVKDEVTITGTCRGKDFEIVLADATL